MNIAAVFVILLLLWIPLGIALQLILRHRH